MFIFYAAHSQEATLRDSLKEFSQKDTQARHRVTLLRNQAIAQNDRRNQLHQRLDSLRSRKANSVHNTGLQKQILLTKKEFDINQQRFDSTLTILDSTTGAWNKLYNEMKRFLKRHPEINQH
jgi:hypothetical protein